MCGVQYGSFFFLVVFLFHAFPQIAQAFLNYFEVDPVALIITGITFVFTFHTRYISIVRCSVYPNSAPLDKSLEAQRRRKV